MGTMTIAAKYKATLKDRGTGGVLRTVQRLKEAMTQIYQKFQGIKESAQPDARHEISQLVKPMTQALDAAFNHEHEQQQKSSKAGSKPMGFDF